MYGIIAVTAHGERQGGAPIRTMIGAVAVVVLVVVAARLFSPSGGGTMSESILNPSHDAAYAETAVRFSETLMRGDFDGAHGQLSPRLRRELPAAALRDRYEEMIEYGDGPASSVQLVSTMEHWPDRQPNDAGWAYISIEGPEFMEGIAVIVEETGDALTIRDIEWGRP